MSTPTETTPIGTAVDKHGTWSHGHRIRARYAVLDATEHRVLVRYVSHVADHGTRVVTDHEAVSEPVWLSRARFRVFWGERP